MVAAGLFFSGPAGAGVIDISYSFSTRQSFIDDDNYTKSLSHTASVAWYFMEMSAIEISYTQGDGEVSGKADTDTTAVVVKTRMNMYDASLVLTFAKKDSIFQPYIKGGGAFVDKRQYRTDAIYNNKLISQTDKDELVPSFGAGFRWYLTKHISLRAGYDRWRSGKNADGDEIWDDAVRAGLSFTF